MIKYLSIFVALTVVSCTPRFNKAVVKSLVETETRFQDHTGFFLYDISADRKIIDYKANQYFTPASNTKILTFYTCLTILGDSLPALKIVEHEDSLIFLGTGDPSFLNQYVFNNERTYSYLKNSPKPLYFSSSNFFEKRYGAGWAWDDYAGSYQPEMSPLPIYSNLLTARYSEQQVWIEPGRLATNVILGDREENAKMERDERANTFTFFPDDKVSKREFAIPFITSDSLLFQLLQDTLQRKIGVVNTPSTPDAKFFYSTPVDSVYKVMMQESDNFLAEQLLLMCSAIITDSLASNPAIRFMEQNHFVSLPDKIKWVDGSGLSRYNLVTPRSIVSVWKLIYEKMPAQRLLPLLAIGGVNGTVKNWYASETPYIFGKTGTLANNHCLSGYLLTKSGKTLIFSFMNSNYLASTSDIRRNMQQILEYIRDNYK